jgi:putative cardiolipin synthase
VAVAALLLALPACISVPFDYPREASSASPPGNDTPMGEDALRWQGEHGENSGFLALAQGVEGLGARLKMIELAGATIDAQYFLIKPDRAGALFAGKLLLAADRGVKVRLLLDDIFTEAPDGAMALLNTHPNIEVRLFNPMSRKSFKYWNYLLDFKRANRRMHNKSFTVDGSLSIVGGRNIAEEYFDLNDKVLFDDYEVLTIGPVVEQISAGFDEFWNNDLAVPMEAFGIEVDATDLRRWRDKMQNTINNSEQGIYGTAVNTALVQDILNDRLQPLVAPGTLITDSPEKLKSAIGDRDQATLATEIGRRFRAAESEIVIITPYFVPLKQGLEALTRLLDRGVRVIVITNSLASNNHTAVHSGYARYRKPLLLAGAELYEIKADAVTDAPHREVNPKTVTLHTKATIVDRKTVFIGSLNFDPRSVDINTEMGLFIDSEEAGIGLYRSVEASLALTTYRLSLDDKGNLQWNYSLEGQTQILDREPLASFGRRFMAGCYGLLPLENQL